MLQGIRIAAWLVILAGALVSAFGVVTALSAMQFDQVASAGLPALYCLAAGSLVLAVTHMLKDRAAVGGLLGDLVPTSPAGLLGLVLLAGGVGWVIFVYASLDETLSAWGIIPAAPGGLAAVIGLVLMLASAGRRPRAD